MRLFTGTPLGFLSEVLLVGTAEGGTFINVLFGSSIIALELNRGSDEILLAVGMKGASSIASTIHLSSKTPGDSDAK
jgi:hypothetical protein